LNGDFEDTQLSAGSIDAYDDQHRVLSYDADMDVMHPNRVAMAKVIIEFLPFASGDAVTLLDLGIGTGYLTRQVLLAYTAARVIGVDGANAMVELATARLGAMAGRVEFMVSDFRTLDKVFSSGRSVDAVVSSYALHHLDTSEKLTVLETCLSLLKPGGIFANADLIVASSQFVERRIQQLRVSAIVERAAPADQRFRDEPTTRQFLDDLEAREGDRPMTISAELNLLREAGFVDVDMLWLEHREAVTVGRRPLSPAD
jgi:ubiquinone/menaquinone biosynthesis C-methylase UbiE